ncbi:extracellular solute-binding protein [Arthrobacter flavus]
MMYAHTLTELLHAKTLGSRLVFYEWNATMSKAAFSWSKAAVLTASVLLLTACGAGDDSGEAGASREDTTLIVYSNSVSDGRGEWLADRAETEGFNIELVDLGAGDIQNRLIAEKGNPAADVAFGPTNVQFETLKEAAVLENYTPEWASEVEEYVAGGEDGAFWPIVREPIMLIHNTEAYPAGEGPQSWPDLWENEKFHGKYETQTVLGGGTTRMVITGILAPYFDENGKLGVSDEGWTAIEEFFANGNPSIEGTDLFARMANGEVDAGQMWLAGKFSREEEYGITTEAANPETGVPFVYQNIGLVAGSENQEISQEFIDWFGSAEVQAAWSQEFFTAPTNAAAIEDANTEAVEATSAFTEQDIDWAVVAENVDAWMEEIELNYIKL